MKISLDTIVPYLVPTMTCVVIVTYLYSISSSIGYGRFTDTKKVTIPSCFAWVIMEAPAILSFLAIYAYFTKSFSPFLFFENLVASFWNGEIPFEVCFVQFFGVAMFSLHYVFRAFIYPFLGTQPFRPMELSIAISGAFFCTLNGSVLAYELTTGTTNALQYLPKWVLTVFQTLGFGFEVAGEDTHPLMSFTFLLRLAGVVCFFSGWYINQQSDAILRSLRVGDDSKERKYKTPHGGMFEYVSCANYFGEILEWFGFFLTLQTFTSLLFLLGTMANLVPRAKNYHEYYLKKIDDYPKDRKIVFPYLY